MPLLCLFDHHIEFIIRTFMQYILHQCRFPKYETHFCNVTCKRHCVKVLSGLEIKPSNSIHFNQH